ncbi:MAG: hypothetical protein BWY76_02510 [bacterium ADurb.Bin429]|nr:MAG: hypothetical protein BWY76_02510 [bacterium ADurb.Bin429]
MSTCSWIADATGYATVNVYVREVGQSRTGKASASILVVPPVTDVTLTANRPFPQPAGTPITFTATAVGGTTPIYQYELSRYDPVTRTWRAFYQVRAFNISRTFTLTPTLPGDLRLRVNVRESGQPGILATKDLDFTIVPALSAVDVQASPYPGTVGVPVTVTANPTGGMTPEYRFFCYVMDWEGNIVEQELRGYEASNTTSFIPTTDHVGTVTLTVLAREQGSTAAYAVKGSISYRIYSATDTQPDVLLAANHASPQPAGTSWTFTATAVHIQNPIYQYELSRYQPDTGTWRAFYQVRAFNTSPTFTLTPVIPGDLRMRVNVRESGRPDVLATADMDFTVLPATP